MAGGLIFFFFSLFSLCYLRFCVHICGGRFFSVLGFFCQFGVSLQILVRSGPALEILSRNAALNKLGNSWLNECCLSHRCYNSLQFWLQEEFLIRALSVCLCLGSLGGAVCQLPPSRQLVQTQRGDELQGDEMRLFGPTRGASLCSSLCPPCSSRLGTPHFLCSAKNQTFPVTPAAFLIHKIPSAFGVCHLQWCFGFLRIDGGAPH